MNTTTNTRGVSEAMVAELIAAGDFLAMNGTDGMVRRWEKAKAALSAPEPAAQGEAVADECPHEWVDYVQAEYKPRHRVFEPGGESNIARYVRIGLMCTTCGKEKPAPATLSAQPAERVPEGWRVLQIGAVGSAYDPPNTHRAFTYDWQPGNGGAWALGMASSTAAKTSAGDYIDDGLNLLKALQEQGFGVFQIEPASPAPSEGGKGVEG